MKQIQAAVGVIYNESNQVLVMQRHSVEGELWELPGGKLEPGEQPLDALHREMQEEIGITVVDAHFIDQFDYTYPDRHVILHAWEIVKFDGEPHGAEGQAIRWVDIAQLDRIDTHAANDPLLKLLKEA